MWGIIRPGSEFAHRDVQRGEPRTLCNWYGKHIWDRFLLLHSVTFIVKKRQRKRRHVFLRLSNRYLILTGTLVEFVTLMFRSALHKELFLPLFLGFSLEEVTFFLTFLLIFFAQLTNLSSFAAAAGRDRAARYWGPDSGQADWHADWCRLKAVSK